MGRVYTTGGWCFGDSGGPVLPIQERPLVAGVAVGVDGPSSSRHRVGRGSSPASGTGRGCRTGGERGVPGGPTPPGPTPCEVCDSDAYHSPPGTRWDSGTRPVDDSSGSSTVRTCRTGTGPSPGRGSVPDHWGSVGDGRGRRDRRHTSTRHGRRSGGTGFVPDRGPSDGCVGGGAQGRSGSRPGRVRHGLCGGHSRSRPPSGPGSVPTVTQTS